ncbi:MAG TPA: aldo/keto reductase [Bryobacteraceae bacterium]|nr:aldo/keto reductase [Bryobacteraceae bacterium]
MSISRREFLETAAAGTLAAGSLMADGSSAGMPTRVLGKTGARVSILAMGGGSRFLQYSEDQAAEAVHKALDLGVSYIDTCDDYGKDHLSERRIGAAIKGRRDRIFLATKVTTRVPEDVPRVVELSLKCLQVDHVDLLHIHSLSEEDDLARVETKGGVLDQVRKLRDQKVTRFIGVTSHTNPAVLARALERHDFDCTQMALNAGTVAMMGGAGGKMVPNPAMKASFETVALPVAIRKKMGVLGMKVFAQDALIGQASPDKLLYYTLSLPVTAAVVSMPKFEHIEQNTRLAKAFRPLSPAEMRDLSTRLSEKNKEALERFFRHHVDA